MPKTREEIEAKRGIYRDEEGRIIRSKEWLQERITYLQERYEDLQRRGANVKVEIKERTKELNEQ